MEESVESGSYPLLACCLYNSSEEALFNDIGCWKMVQEEEEEGGHKVIFLCWLPRIVGWRTVQEMASRCRAQINGEWARGTRLKLHPAFVQEISWWRACSPWLHAVSVKCAFSSSPALNCLFLRF